MKGMVDDRVYVVLFRGVGGATQLPTKPLREALLAAGFGSVATYINSGNAIVSTDLDLRDATAKIAAISKQAFGFAKDIFLISRTEWIRLIRANPFPEAVGDPTKLHLFILGAVPKKDAIVALCQRVAGGERVMVRGRALYLQVPKGFSDSKLPPVIDRTLGVVSTARNWNTVVKLRELADKAT